jgi:mono/diheme cytochrome c family protein
MLPRSNAPLVAVALLLAAACLSAGCRGQISRLPPLHPQQNMDQQARVDAQEPSEFFADGRGTRPRIAGTVPGADPRGDSNPCTIPEDDPHYCSGKSNESGDFATTLPAGVTLGQALLDRGQERFDIYCAPCHDRVGNADGLVARRGMKPISFHSDTLRGRPVGKLFDTISKGGPIMPPYAAQIPVADRWAIAAYVRALQVSQHATLDQVPADLAQTQGWK